MATVAHHARRPSTTTIAAGLAVVFVLLLACAPGALAARPHELTGTFGTPCAAGPCTGASLKKPNGVAVNEATGDVYVVDEGANRVVRFNAKGEFQSEFNGSGLLPGEGVAAGFKEPKEPGEVETGRFEEPQTIAVDNSCALRKLSEAECKARRTPPDRRCVCGGDAGHEMIERVRGERRLRRAVTRQRRWAHAALDGVAVDSDGVVWLWPGAARRRLQPKAQRIHSAAETKSMGTRLRSGGPCDRLQRQFLRAPGYRRSGWRRAKRQDREDLAVRVKFSAKKSFRRNRAQSRSTSWAETS